MFFADMFGQIDNFIVVWPPFLEFRPVSEAVFCPTTFSAQEEYYTSNILTSQYEAAVQSMNVESMTLPLHSLVYSDPKLFPGDPYVRKGM